MSGWLRGMGARLRGLVLRGREEAELEEEIRFHIEEETSKLLRQGWSATAARREAYRRFGGVERMKERTRDERGTGWVDDIARDVRYAGRTLRRAPGFSVMAVLTLALGIGATTAMFSLVQGVLLRGLPYPASERLITVHERTADGGSTLASYANFADWREGSPALEALAAYTPPSPETVLGPSGGVRARVTAVSADFFQVAGVAAALGRVTGPGENRPGGPPVAVVSHGFWRDVLGGPTDLAGVTVNLRGEPWSVVGVMPAGFDLPAGAEVWLTLDRQVPWTVRGNHVVQVMGRMTADAELPRARAELERVQAGIHGRYPEVETVGVRVQRLQEEMVGSSRSPLVLLLVAAGFLLLVACANVASALLARGAGRRRELALRASLGAGRGRLVRQLLVESLVLAGLGAVAALGLAATILRITRLMAAGAVPRLAEVGLDGSVLLFAAAAALVTGLLFGVLPALRLTMGDLAASARGGSAGGDERRVRRGWRLIMAGEVAMAVALLSGAGLLVRSLAAILDRDVGFDPEGVVTARLDFPGGKFQTAAEGVSFLDELTGSLRARPGVQDAGLGLLLPVRGAGSLGSPVLMEDGSRSDAVLQYRVADAGYFRTLDVPLVAGRWFGEQDGPESPHAALVDESTARRLWPGEDPLGKRFNPRGMDPYPDEWLTVVGVVGDVRDWSQSPGANPTFYVSYRQRPAFLVIFGMSLVVKGDDAGALADMVRTRVRQMAPDIPVETGTLERSIARSAGDRRFTAFVLGGFALLALLLAAAGVYGVVGYTVARRTREMGIRLALGARPRQVRGGVQREALMVVTVGIVVGLALAVVLARSARTLLFEVGPADPWALLGGAVLLGAAAWLASWVPAWRGTRLDPARTLRAE